MTWTTPENATIETWPSKRRGGRCKSCGGFQDMGLDWAHDDRPVWVCRCCGAVEPRIKRLSAKRKRLNKIFDEMLKQSTDI